MILRIPHSQPLHIHRIHFLLLALLLLPLSVAYAVLQLSRPVPAVAVHQTLRTESLPPVNVDLPWPAIGSAAVAVDGLGQVAAYKDEKQRPIASLVKMMTAYVVMKDHPIRLGETGPDVMIGPDDVRAYQAGIANDESVVLVRQGQAITESDLLQGLLIPSANNMGFTLARWSSGSQDAFVQRMNEEAAALGMKNSHYADASGVSQANVSTASDQVILAQALMANPVLAQIVGLKQTSLPLVGTMFNVDALLGQSGIVGVKTGWTEDAGGCFVFAADIAVDGRPTRIYGAVLGQGVLADAFNTTRALIPATASNLHIVKVAAQGAPAATVDSRWGESGDATLPKDVSFILWPGTPVNTHVEQRHGRRAARERRRGRQCCDQRRRPERDSAPEDRYEDRPPRPQVAPAPRTLI